MNVVRIEELSKARTISRMRVFVCGCLVGQKYSSILECERAPAMRLPETLGSTPYEQRADCVDAPGFLAPKINLSNGVVD